MTPALADNDLGTTEPRMKVLIVDDDAVNLDVLNKALRSSVDVLVAQNGYDAISLLEEQSPDLVLLDIMMPEMDGLQVCRLMRATPGIADIPVIFVTAADSQDSEYQGLELGAVDYLTKPLDIRLARLRIRNQLEMRRQRNLIQAQNEQLTRKKADLEETLGRVRRLEGMLSICMSCKKIRAEGNDWQRVEQYLSVHTDAVFSHGLCPTCFEQQNSALR